MYRCPTCGEETQWLGNIRRHIRECMPADKSKKPAAELRIPGRKRPPGKSARVEKAVVKIKRKRGRRGRQGQRLLDWRATMETQAQKGDRQRKGRNDKFKYWVRSGRELPEWCARRLATDSQALDKSMEDLRREHVEANPVRRRIRR